MRLKKRINTDDKYRLVFVIFIALNLVVNVVRYVHFKDLNYRLDWPSVEMMMSYKYGFIRRGLLGSVAWLISLIFNLNIITGISLAQFAGEILFCISLILIIAFLLKQCQTQKQKHIVILLFSVFIQMFGFNFYLYDWGEPDVYMISLTILAAFLILKDKHIFAVVPICCIGEMIHEGYALMYFSIVFALLFYSFWVETDTAKKRKKFAVLSLAILATASLFFYFYFISKPINKYTCNEVIEEMQNHCGETLSQLLKDNVKYIWFGADTYSLPLWENGKPTVEFFNRIYCIICAVITCLPSFLFIIIVWISRIKNFKEKEKILSELVCFFSVFTVMPLIIVHADTARWISDFVLYESIILSVLTIYDGKKTEEFFKKNKITNNGAVKFVFVAFVFITAFLLKSDKWSIFENVLNFLNRISIK
ncbi:MAG: hypothetical protein MJ168_07480 [Clostridia bacterium]|nr:hypothetical protein [Clostridia bacterium]